MEIIDAAVHQLLKTAQAKGCVAKVAAGPMVVDEALTELVRAISDTYSRRTSQRTGTFGSEAHYPFPKNLRTYIFDGGDFFAFTQWAADELALRIADELFANGGYVFFCNYRVPQGQFLLVAKLTNASGASFSEDMTHATPSVYLNVRELQQVGRINVGGWKDNAKKYLTFVSAKESGHASDYFVKFLGCAEVASNTVETNKLVSVMQAFCEDQKLSEEDSSALRQRAYDYARGLPGGTAMSLAAMANAAWPDNPEQLTTFINANDDAPSDDLVPTPAALKRLINWKLKMKGMTLNMTDQFKTEHKVEITYGKHLVIHNVSEDIIQELGGA